MANLKVWIDEGCMACGVCQDLCPDVFEVTDMAAIISGIDYDQYTQEIQEARDSCPMEVIKLEI